MCIRDRYNIYEYNQKLDIKFRINYSKCQFLTPFILFLINIHVQERNRSFFIFLRTDIIFIAVKLMMFYFIDKGY